eukprot:4176732-Prymnesium_polylepis.1
MDTKQAKRAASTEAGACRQHWAKRTCTRRTLGAEAPCGMSCIMWKGYILRPSPRELLDRLLCVSNSRRRDDHQHSRDTATERIFERLQCRRALERSEAR